MFTSIIVEMIIWQFSGIPLVAVIGESEIAEGVITLKNMSTRDEEKPTREEFIQKVKDTLSKL